MSSTYSSVARFVAREAFLLSDQKWEEWLAMFDTDGVYWMPAHPDQTDPLHHVSHIYESATLRELRVKRFRDTLAISLQPAPRSVRHVSNLLVDTDSERGEVTARASLLAAQYAYNSVQEFHGLVTWRLRPHEDSYRIALKRVDLLNSDGWLSDVLTYL